MEGETYFDHQELQWGHRLSAVETRLSTRNRCVIVSASMGPPSFGGGNASGVELGGGTKGVLQWGHRLSAVETRSGRRSSRTASRFNGATVFRRWKRDTAPVARSGRGRASMRPPSFGGGNFPPSHCSRNSCCFNGATVFRRWKLEMNKAAQTAVVASMGPPSFGGGNAGCRLSQPMHPMGLQWGHRLSAVETRREAWLRLPVTPASMGPPSFGGGNATERGLW